MYVHRLLQARKCSSWVLINCWCNPGGDQWLQHICIVSPHLAQISQRSPGRLTDMTSNKQNCIALQMKSNLASWSETRARARVWARQSTVQWPSTNTSISTAHQIHAQKSWAAGCCDHNCTSNHRHCIAWPYLDTGPKATLAALFHDNTAGRSKYKENHSRSCELRCGVPESAQPHSNALNRIANIFVYFVMQFNAFKPTANPWQQLYMFGL